MTRTDPVAPITTPQSVSPQSEADTKSTDEPGLNSLSRTTGARQCTAHVKAKGKNGRRCSNPAVSGYTVCRLHGANPTNHGGRPIQTGKYSRLLRAQPSLLERFEEYRNDPELTNLASEIALLRTALESHVATQLTNSATDGSPATVTGTLLDRISNLSDQIGKLVERQHKIEYGETFTLNVNMLVTYAARIATIINEEVDDPESRLRIRNKLEDLFAEGQNSGAYRRQLAAPASTS